MANKRKSRNIKRFNEKTYATKKQANELLKEAGIKSKKRGEILELSTTTIHLLAKYPWEEYKAYLIERQIVSKNNKVNKEVSQKGNQVIYHRGDSLVTWETQADQLDRIEAKLDLILDKQNKDKKTKFFGRVS